MHGKCPSCEKSISKVKIDGIQGDVVGGRSYNCVSYICPYCNIVISVQIDPIAIKTDIVNVVK